MIVMNVEFRKITIAICLKFEGQNGRHQDIISDLNNLDWQNEFVRLLDYRFKPLISGRLIRSEGLEDSDRKATRGMLMAWAALCKDFKEFTTILNEHYISVLGFKRLKEYYRALAMIKDPVAYEKLMVYAEIYAANSGKAASSQDAYEIFVYHVIPEYQSRPDYTELLALFLATVNYNQDPGVSDGSKIRIAMESALLCGKHRYRAAGEGILRLLEATTYNVSYERFRVMKALYETGGDDHYEGLYSLYEKAINEAMPFKNEDARSLHTFTLLSHECILLAMRPQDYVLKQRIIDRVEMILSVNQVLCSLDLDCLAVIPSTAKVSGVPALISLSARIGESKLTMAYSYQQKEADEVRQMAWECAQ